MMEDKKTRSSLGDEENIVLEARALTKKFGEFVANQDISLKIFKGQIHGIVGENGAGKSTLLNMLFGFTRPDAGDLVVKGQPRVFSSALDGLAAGVCMVHQHFMLVDNFTVLENIILGAETHFDTAKCLAEARPELEKMCDRYGFKLDLDAVVETLGVGYRQQLEILKALYRGADILILDEPTAVLTPQETEGLFRLLKELAAEGTSILFVTHKLREIIAITDQVTVMRHGQIVCDIKTPSTSIDALAEAMIGASIQRRVHRELSGSPGVKRLILKSIYAHNDQGQAVLKNINLEILSGQVLGIAGVAGGGQSELIEVLTGLRQVTKGSVRLNGNIINSQSVKASPAMLRDWGLAHIAEDRLKQGSVSQMSAAENIMLGYQTRPPFSNRFGFLDEQAQQKRAQDVFERQDVRPSNPFLAFGAFSGGNQQKIVIARELAENPQILVFDQPTRGVDIGAVTLIHDQITSLRNEGKAIVLISADLDELLALADAIAVMNEGQIMGVIPVGEASPKRLGLMMAGDQSAGLYQGESQKESHAQ